MVDGTLINNAMNEYFVLNNVSTVAEIIVRNKAGATAGNVHVCLWLLEGTAHRIRLEGVDDVMPTNLVDEPKRTPKRKWPW